MSVYQDRLNAQWERNRIEQEKRDLRQAKIDQQRYDDRMDAIKQSYESSKSWQTGGWGNTSVHHNPSVSETYNPPVSGTSEESPPTRSHEEVVDDLTGGLLFLTTVVLGGWAGYAVFAAGAGLIAALVIFAGIGLVLHWNPVRTLIEVLVRVFLWLVRLLLWAALAGGALYLASLFL